MSGYTITPLTREALLARLAEYAQPETDPEQVHPLADQALLDYLDDPGIAVAFEKITKWYA